MHAMGASQPLQGEKVPSVSRERCGSVPRSPVLAVGRRRMTEIHASD